MRVTDFTEGDYLKKRRHLLWFPLFEEETAGHVSSVAASTSTSSPPPPPPPPPPHHSSSHSPLLCQLEHLAPPWCIPVVYFNPWKQDLSLAWTQIYGDWIAREEFPNFPNILIHLGSFEQTLVYWGQLLNLKALPDVSTPLTKILKVQDCDVGTTVAAFGSNKISAAYPFSSSFPFRWWDV